MKITVLDEKRINEVNILLRKKVYKDKTVKYNVIQSKNVYNPVIEIIEAKIIEDKDFATKEEAKNYFDTLEIEMSKEEE